MKLCLILTTMFLDAQKSISCGSHWKHWRRKTWGTQKESWWGNHPWHYQQAAKTNLSRWTTAAWIQRLWAYIKRKQLHPPQHARHSLSFRIQHFNNRRITSKNCKFNILIHHYFNQLRNIRSQILTTLLYFMYPLRTHLNHAPLVHVSSARC